MSFYALQVFFEDYYFFAPKPDKFFWARIKEKSFGFEWKQLE